MDTDLLVFLGVVGVRVFLPLLIFKYPLPAILGALIADAVDQTVFQTLAPGIDISEDGELNYQGYDKALDIYYLTLAYLSTFRNWLNPMAVVVGAFLWYYRLFGVALFELTGWRALLIIFPNTFEYYFIFIALARALGWRDTRLSNRQVVTAAAAIWVFIKLPQEFWLHVAQLDVTEQLAERPWLWGVLAVGLLALVVAGVYVWRRLPPPDHAPTVVADRIHPFPGPQLDRRWSDGLAEKVLLLSLITIIFTKAVRAETSNLDIFLAVAIVVSGNAGITQWLRSRGRVWSSTAQAFVASLLVNGSILLGMLVFLPDDGTDTDWAGITFFLALVSLIISLFDHYHRPQREPLEAVGAEVPTIKLA